MIPQMRPVLHRAAAARSHTNHRSTESEGHGGNELSAADAKPTLEGDIAATIADEVARRSEFLMLAQRKEADASELAMDRMRARFDEQEQERAELLREWNVMRDMAMEQMKRDNEIMKKWIMLI